MDFEELDSTTRQHMQREFEAEWSGPNPYVSRALSTKGREAYPGLMRQAIASGNEESLASAMASPDLWNPKESYERKGVVRERDVNFRQAAERLALSEFNTWYVRGLARRLMNEGVASCQAYRAAQPRWEPADCSSHEGQIYAVEAIYRGHRARYWPVQNLEAVSIPFGPGCHHTIRRIG
jgi:hypothetical protein